MLLITLHEWLGPSSKMTEEQKERTYIIERDVAFATHLHLSTALDKLAEYKRAYNRYYYLALSWTLIGVSDITPILPDEYMASGETLNELNVSFVEDLSTDF